MKPKIFVTRKLSEEALALLANKFEMSLNTEDRVLEKTEIIQQIKDKDALLCLLTDTIDKAVFDAAPNLKVVSNYAVGFNNIDIKEANRRKIPVCITPGILTEATADLTFALILSVTRRIVEADQYTRKGLFTGWGPTLFLGTELSGKTLGIVGMGRIGQAVAKRALGFNMKIIYHSKTPKDFPEAQYVTLKELLQKSDIISLHTPLTPETHHLIDKNAIAQMKKTVFLINTTRGPVVDETALIEALRKKDIAGAGLDVYEEEPKLKPGLIELDNVVILPHIGSATYETRNKMAVLAAENAIRVCIGEYPHALANPEVL